MQVDGVVGHSKVGEGMQVEDVVGRSKVGEGMQVEGVVGHSKRSRKGMGHSKLGMLLDTAGRG